MALEEALTARRVARSGGIERPCDLDAPQVGSRARLGDVDAGRIRPQERQARRLGDRGRLLHECDLHLMRPGLHRNADLPVLVGPVALCLSLTISPAGSAPARARSSAALRRTGSAAR